MRLIDADEFKKYVSEGYEQSKDLFQTDEYRNIAGTVTQGILKDIDEQPTAYDVDKVCEELKFATRKGTLRACDFTGILGAEDYKGAFVSTQQAIDIVRRGGLND